MLLRTRLIPRLHRSALRDAAAFRMINPRRPTENLARDLSLLQKRHKHVLLFRHVPLGRVPAAVERAPKKESLSSRAAADKPEDVAATGDQLRPSSEKAAESSELSTWPFFFRGSNLFTTRAGFEASETGSDYVYNFGSGSVDGAEEDVKVSVIRERLLRVEHKMESKSPKDAGYMSQQSVHSFTLPSNSMPEDVRAEMIDGRLVVTVPKKNPEKGSGEEKKEREIPVRGATDSA